MKKNIFLCLPKLKNWDARFMFIHKHLMIKI